MSFITKIWGYTPAGLIYNHVLKPGFGGGTHITENEETLQHKGSEEGDYTMWILLGTGIFVVSTIGLLLYIG